MFALYLTTYTHHALKRSGAAFWHLSNWLHVAYWLYAVPCLQWPMDVTLGEALWWNLYPCIDGDDLLVTYHDAMKTVIMADMCPNMKPAFRYVNI